MFPRFCVFARGLILLSAAGFLAGIARAQTFNYLTSIGDVGNPTGVSLDVIGGITYLYVSDHNGGRVFKYNLATGARTQIGFPGRGQGQFVWPDAIAIEPVTHDLYIPDRQLHRVVRIKNTGEYVMSWGGDGTATNRFGFPGAGTAPGQFNEPVGAIIDAAGNLYISEHENHRVQKFRITQTNGAWNIEVLKIWGSGGSSPGQFNTPYCVTLDGAGNVWVTDGYNSRVQKFTPDGALLGEISIRGANEPHLVCTWITFDQAGDFYVSITSDPNTGGVLQNQRVQKFNVAGTTLGRWGTYGSEPGNFKLPFGIAIDRATHRAYVADWDNGRVQVFDVGGSTPTGRPTITQQPPSRAAAAGSPTTFTTGTTSASATFQWQLNGANLAGATGSTLTIGNVQPANAGVYTAVVTDNGQSSVTNPAILAVTSTAKVTGAGSEVGPNIRHPNGNIYDQILLQGAAATVTADPGQVVRMSYEDLNHDIVQVEFSGAGALTLTLDNASGPATAQNYNQPGVTYMRGHGSVVIAGADESTNVSVFSVGRANAVDQTLFRSDVTYDGWADIASVAILSVNGKFGGVRTGNTTFSGTRSSVGLLAPGVAFTGPVVLGDIAAADAAQPVLLLGSSVEASVAGGDMAQLNARPIQVSGINQLRFVGGTSSQGTTIAPQQNAGRFERDGVDVTSQIVAGP